MITVIQNLPTYFDYNWLSHQLNNYASPRSKINRLIKKGEITRVKKGIYIPGPKYKRDYSRGLLSNLIYGPSYISFEFALSWYNLIPEKVAAVTAANSKKKKSFHTPIGLFTYQCIPKNAYAVGLTMVKESGSQFIIATPEKALADILSIQKTFPSRHQVKDYLFDGLRIEPSSLSELNLTLLEIIGLHYDKKNVFNLIKVLSGKIT